MGPKFTTDEAQPRPSGHYIARATHGWPGTIFYVWMVLKASLMTPIITGLWVPPHAITPMWLCIPTMILGAAAFGFNVFFFGTGAKKRTSSNKDGSNATILHDRVHAVSPLGPLDRLVRAAQDQQLVTGVTACVTFLMIFMVKFYWDNGHTPFLPLTSPTPTGTAIELRNTVLVFNGALLGISGIATFIVLATWGDTLKRMQSGHYPDNDVEVEMSQLGAQQQQQQQMQQSVALDAGDW